ncbi:MAG: hypothetical protein Ct9H300mP28_18000 [Pseudomonadota bacterium]|nr:MAG: hypothetical protein Ct9H300mP28_18000 [Pseudomonadota bacterium]
MLDYKKTGNILNKLRQEIFSHVEILSFVLRRHFQGKDKTIVVDCFFKKCSEIGLSVSNMI